ncbi:MAG: helix-hairpin-helix domain-containing protein, partial [Bacteroidota bacterium]|nr:helix-hairpin-helix domain-containing protein [Bacteroidota bacterium]
INSLKHYIRRNGALLSIYELQLIPGFTDEVIFNIIPFITTKEEKNKIDFNFKNAIKYGSNQVFIRTQDILENRKGYSDISDADLLENPNSRYLGSSPKLYTRYKYHYKNKLYYGITAEKDAGEEFFKGNNKNGFDYYSAHLQIKDFGFVKTLVLGDYEIKFGQGLVLWSSMSFGKSPYVLNNRKKAQGIRKYSSTNENQFMRGAGTTVAFNNFELSAFYSKKKIDANITDSIDNEISAVSSFQNSGIHATPSAITDKDAIGEVITGGNITYNHRLFKVGLTYAEFQYDAKLFSDPSTNNMYDFQGDNIYNIGFDYQFSIKDISFFGEEAICKNGGMAFLNGALFYLVPQIALSAIHRHYEPEYQGLYSNAFAENSSNSNEDGLYFGLEVHPIKHLTVKTYYDSYSFPWLSYRADAPTTGYDFFSQLDYNLNRHTSMHLRFRRETKETNADSELGLKQINSKYLQKLRFHISYEINKNLQFKNRIVLSEYKEELSNKEYGFMIYQDVDYDFTKIPLSLSCRFALFDTDTYNTRIYAYEKDVLYAFSIPAYYSKGSRFYLNIKYSIRDYIDIWLRYSQTYFSEKNTISSGLNEIYANTKSQIKAQIRFKF